MFPHSRGQRKLVFQVIPLSSALPQFLLSATYWKLNSKVYECRNFLTKRYRLLQKVIFEHFSVKGSNKKVLPFYKFQYLLLITLKSHQLTLSAKWVQAFLLEEFKLEPQPSEDLTCQSVFPQVSQLPSFLLRVPSDWAHPIFVFFVFLAMIQPFSFERSSMPLKRYHF